jgi:hypothetical protein
MMGRRMGRELGAAPGVIDKSLQLTKTTKFYANRNADKVCHAPKINNINS